MAKREKKLYFDYAATTPLDRRVHLAMEPYWSGKFGNPSSLHFFGQEAQAALDAAREKVAAELGADFREIIFTASATEANNLALRGAVRAAGFISRGAGRSSAPAAEADLRSRRAGAFGDQAQRASESRRSKQILPPQIVISSIEHESVLKTAQDLERQGVEVVYLPVDNCGRVSLSKLKQALNERTVLVSVMYANNETGAIQPISEIAEIIKDFKKTLSPQPSTPNPLPSTLYPMHMYPLLHSDAVQAFQYLDCNVNQLGVDLMTLSGHKIYGPKGVGVLYRRQESSVKSQDTYRLLPIITGGGQEFGLRSGTENVPLIVGVAKAMELAAKARTKEVERIAALRDYFLRGLRKRGIKFKMNSPATGVLPNILNLFFPDFPADELVSRLDMLGIAVGTGSACASRAPETSHVLRAVGFPEARAKRSIRISFGRPTTKSQVDIFLKRVQELKSKNGKGKTTI
jgi:cysteine desulfurase